MRYSYCYIIYGGTMAKYLVGNDDWLFYEAYNAASDGDIIEFDEGFYLNLEKGESFTISKNLTFIGHVITRENGGKTFTNNLYGKLVIDNGATATFKNFWVDPLDDRAAFYVTNQSTLILDTIVFENSYRENTCVVVYSQKQSTVQMSQVETKAADSKNLSSKFKFCDNSNVTITDSRYLNNSIIVESHSKLLVSNSNITYYHGNVINSKNSTVTLSQTNITGATSDKDWPALVFTNSILNTSNTSVVQKEYAASVYLMDCSIINSRKDFFSSLKLSSSRATLEHTTIGIVLSLYKCSSLFSAGNLNLKGEYNKRVDIYANEKSILVTDTIILNRTANPNIRLEDSSFFYAKLLDYPNGDTDKLNFNVDDSSQLIKEKVGQVDTITENEPVEPQLSAREELNQLVGLKRVKEQINVMLTQVQANQMRAQKGLKTQQMTLNAVFMGNPGTGKTTVARLLGRALFEAGVLVGEEFKFIEVSEPDLISQNVGGTAIQTKNILDKAKGGVLFIDEAYTLHKKEGINHGQEAINTIMKYMEDHRNEIMIIFAGYTKEMEAFLKTNPGLTSRAPNRFDFEDFTTQEIVSLGITHINNEQFKLEDEEYYARQVSKGYRSSLDKSNGRWIRNFNEKLTATMLNRIVAESSEDVTTILNKDIDSVTNQGQYQEDPKNEDALQQLENLIGIAKVKEQVKDFIAQAVVNQQREEQGLSNPSFTLHSMFLGNPGTGKTTVARIIGKLLYQKGLTSQNKFIEVGRSDLVGSYIGHTAIKTREVLESALGGVLFIDEAYTLSKGGDSRDFGREAIDEILKFMEDHRSDIVIIFAGYTKEMGEFLRMNSGLQSRIPNTFDFEDYSPEEIVQIGLLGIKAAKYTIDTDHYAQIVKASYLHSSDHSNGRWIRNFNEKLLRIVSRRITQSGTTDLTTITNEDLERLKESIS